MQTCARCGRPVVGYAFIHGARYCHDSSRMCYTKTLREFGHPISTLSDKEYSRHD